MSWAGCQNNPIDVNFWKVLKESTDKIGSNKFKRVKMPCSVATTTWWGPCYEINNGIYSCLWVKYLLICLLAVSKQNFNCIMSIILNHKSNQCSSLQCIQIFFESIVGMLSIYVLMQVLSICKERIFITIQEFTSFQTDGISIKLQPIEKIE